MDKNPATIPAPQVSGEFMVYETENGRIRLEVRLENETLWLTQKTMAELFGTSVDNVGLHLKNAHSEGELEETATTEDFSVVQQEFPEMGFRQKSDALKFKEQMNWLRMIKGHIAGSFHIETGIWIMRLLIRLVESGKYNRFLATGWIKLLIK